MQQSVCIFLDQKADRIVWVDCEMTGLEVNEHTIVEIALIVTDAQLNIIAEGPDIVIHHDEETLSRMNDWCKTTFAKNGLIEKIHASKVEMAEAEEQILAFLMEHVHENQGPLAGNSVYNDRLFIKKYMPRVDAYIHHDHIDVDSIRLLAYRWYPMTIAQAPQKKCSHIALEDIKETIIELAYYKRNVFRENNTGFDLAKFDKFKKRFEKSDRIVWMHCKMAEIELNEKTLVEIAAIVTDRRLNIVSEELDVVIHQDEETLSGRNDECKAIFTKSGLIDKINAGQGVGIDEAEKQILAFLKKHVLEKKAPLAGKSVYVDRLFIRKHMPFVNEYLHYRLIDVSTINELSRRWYPSALESAPIKAMTHRALDDIRESIAQLKHYRANVFIGLILAVAVQWSPRSASNPRVVMNRKDDRIVWVDCEMTGLKVDEHTIVQIAVIVTDAQLNIVAEGPDIIIHHDEETLSRMNDWCKTTFAKNGLTEKIRASEVKMDEAEKQVLDFLKEYVLERQAPLAGNSVYMDRLFIMKYMPLIDVYLDHHLIDVDSISMLSYRWYPQSIACSPKKRMTHRAIDDVKEAIAELKYYKKSVFGTHSGAELLKKKYSHPQFEAEKKKYEKPDRIVWMDCKMVTREEDNHTMLQIAVIVTDRKLNIVAECPEILVHLDEETLSKMNTRCKEAFSENGPIEGIDALKVGMAEAERKVLAFLKSHVVMRKAPLAGNTIYMERIFIMQHMPRVDAYLSHHVIDVDSISELSRRWYPSAFESASPKAAKRRALDDIKASIEELKHYRTSVFKA